MFSCLDKGVHFSDTVKINRLTQRQSVNIPLMKQTIRTMLKDLDDMPVMEFENLDDDKGAEIFANEYWNWTLERNQAEIKDIVDKRQELLTGRSFDQWQICDGMIKFTVQDVEDILVDRFTDPTDLDTARFIIHTHIFKPLSSLEFEDGYDQKAVAKMKMYYASQQGIVKASDNVEMLNQKNKKMAAMGVQDIESPVLGETYVELSMHFVYREKDVTKDGEEKNEQIWVYVECDQMQILMKKPLEEIIGKTKDNYWSNHYPYTSWADDVERQDFWSDGIADVVRTPNKY